MLSSLFERVRALRGRPEVAKPADGALNRIYLQLHQAQRQRHFLDVAIDGDHVSYQSMILALDPTEKTVLIDELFPKGFEGLPGQRLQVTVRQPEGRKLRFRSTILERHSHDGSPIYVLAMPRGVESEQRRNAYRLAVGGADIPVHFSLHDKSVLVASLLNLSTSGIGLLLNEYDAEKLRYDDPLHRVRFEFAGLLVECDMTVRNVASFGEGSGGALVGAEFIQLPAQEQRALERAIARIQRDRLRRSSELESELTQV